ncbi:MAG: FAD-dependent oxidoreductase [Anaerolineae bacterium]
MIVRGVWEDQQVGCGQDCPAGQGHCKLGRLEQVRQYEPGVQVTAILGWDGFLLFGDAGGPEGGPAAVDVVDMARAYMDVVQGESCGKCVPCRMGTRVAADILTRIADGKGEEEDLDTLRRVGELVRAGSMCELGHTSMNAVLALLETYPDEFLRAIHEGKRRPRGSYHTKVTAPCIEACPERLDIPRYIEFIKTGRYTESLSVIHEKNPLASVCGRVCVRFCEFACRRGRLDDPVSIKHLKRFVSDVEMDAAVKRYEPTVQLLPDAKAVAIVGAGPAGITAAYHLLRRGYRVELFEAQGEPGGMAALGIPDYRLPREVLRTEVAVTERMGAKIHYHQRLGRDFSLADLKARGFSAIFVAVGAQEGTAMRVQGEDQRPEGYMVGVDFLRRINLAEPVRVGKSAVVVGGGNVAMDCARSALRLGVEQVHLVYRRTRDEMPADKIEVRDAEEEGVAYHFLANPTRLLIEEGKVVGVECLRMALGEPDASGRRRPEPVPGSEFAIPCDMVIPAIGQKVEAASLQGEGEVTLSKWGTIDADGDTLLTAADGVFAGGDCVSGPATLIEAMAAGFRVSNSIDQYLREGRVALTEDERMSRVFRALEGIDEDPVDRLGAGNEQRIDPAMRPARDRINDFNEVEMGLSPEDALLEADRCLRCYRIILVATAPEAVPASDE